MNFRKLLSEIQRRRVGRVAGVYAVAGWVVIQVVATVFPLLGVSDVIAKIVVILIAIGFPVAVALAWAFDVTPQGIERTEPLPADATTRALSGREYGIAAGYFGIGILVALVAFAALSGVRENRKAHTAEGIRSIAVLPFADLSQNRDQGYFSDGITEELLNRLTQIPDLTVPARTSSFAFRSSTLEVPEIARRLNVEALLEGSVRRDGDKVRVNVRLIDARSQEKLWSSEYEKQVSSVFAIQDEIATDIVNALKLQIHPQPVVATSKTTIDANPAAVDAYMKGLDFWNERSDASLRKAVQLFEQAVAADPDFALGYAMLAQAYAVLPAYGDFPLFEASAKGQAAAARALALNPSQPEAYAALGQMRQNFEWDFESAERSYRRAILFNSGYAAAHQWRAEALLLMGENDESRKEIDAALDLDPASASALHAKAYQHIARHEYAAANRILDRILASNPDYTLALIDKTSLAIMNRQTATARAVMQRLAAGDAAFTNALDAAGAAVADAAYRPAAKAAISALSGRRPASEVALWYALAGLHEEALTTIRSAYDSGSDVNLPLLLLHPAFDTIRKDPEYQSILHDLKMGGEAA